MPLWLSLIILLAALFFLSLQLVIFDNCSIVMDGYSYFDAWETLKSGRPDSLRTPIYPVLIGVIKEIFGKANALVIIPVLHWILYIVSLRGIWDIGNWIGLNRPANIVVMLVLIMIPGFWCFNHISMAEILSLSEMVLLLWLSGLYIKQNRVYLIYLSGATLIVMIFTKPMFIFMIPIMAAFWGVLWERGKSHLIAGAVSVLTSIILISAYCYCMARVYSVNSLTIASSYNNYYCLRVDGLILPEEIKNEDLRERFSHMYEKHPGGWDKTQPYWDEMWQLSWQELDYLVETAVSNHPGEAVDGILNRFKKSMRASQFYTPVEELGLSPEYDSVIVGWDGISRNEPGGYIYPMVRWLIVPMCIGGAIALVFIYLWLRNWLVTRRFPYLPALIAATYISAYVTTVVGAPDSWGRILTPVNPLLPIMAGSIVSMSIPIHKLRK